MSGLRRLRRTSCRLALETDPHTLFIFFQEVRKAARASRLARDFGEVSVAWDDWRGLEARSFVDRMVDAIVRDIFYGRPE